MNITPAGQCTCPFVDPKYWTTHYGAVEPGSMQEYDPTCPTHGELRTRCEELEARLANREQVAADYCQAASDAEARIARVRAALSRHGFESGWKFAVVDILAILDGEDTDHARN